MYREQDSTTEDYFLEKDFTPDPAEGAPRAHTGLPLRPSRLRGVAGTARRIMRGKKRLLIAAGAAALALVLLYRAVLSSSLMVDAPASGGGFTEGIVGTPRFINPVLAASDADRDLTTLVYAGLMRARRGVLQPELAARFTISDDGKKYVFVLREDARFQDGTPVTPEDVVFTVRAIQNPELKSPYFVNWEGVTAEKTGAREVTFTLQEPYAPFLENTTIGILPHHLWKGVRPDEFPFSRYNTKPVGAGPFRVAAIERDENDIPRAYLLRRFEAYVPQAPYLEEIRLVFFKNERAAADAYRAGSIDALARVSPAIAAPFKGTDALATTTLPRVFGVFFNKNRAMVFARKEVRRALDMALDKQALVDFALEGFGTVTNSPLPPGALPKGNTEEGGDADTEAPPAGESRLARAAALLARKGWEKDEKGVWVLETDEQSYRLSFRLATADIPELAAAAEFIKAAWTSLGADVTIEALPPSELTQQVIRPREYDALLFGEIVGRELDLFAFWHSSQRNDPGLNVALYTNITADAELKKARTRTDAAERAMALEKFVREVEADQPAVFLFAPQFLYLVPRPMQQLSIEGVADPAERFNTVNEWFQKTKRAWRGGTATGN